MLDLQNRDNPSTKFNKANAKICHVKKLMTPKVKTPVDGATYPISVFSPYKYIEAGRNSH